MKKIVCAAFLIATAIPAFAADVGVSISVGQPGFYGQINIGNVPPPPSPYQKRIFVRRRTCPNPFETHQ